MKKVLRQFVKRFWVKLWWLSLRHIEGGHCPVDNRIIRTFETPTTKTTVTIQFGKETTYSREEVAVMYNTIEREYQRTNWRPDW